jgi:hypothetical protein
MNCCHASALQLRVPRQRPKRRTNGTGARMRTAFEVRYSLLPKAVQTFNVGRRGNEAVFSSTGSFLPQPAALPGGRPTGTANWGRHKCSVASVKTLSPAPPAGVQRFVGVAGPVVGQIYLASVSRSWSEYCANGALTRALSFHRLGVRKRYELRRAKNVAWWWADAWIGEPVHR